MKYKIYFQENNKLKNIIISANNISDICSNELCPSNIIYIKEIGKLKLNIFYNEKEKIELFYELKIMLESNLSLEESIDILLESNYNKMNKKVLTSIKYALINGLNLSFALKEHENYLGYNTLVFFKIADEQANITQCIGALYEMLKTSNNIKKSLYKSLSYPIVLVASLFISIYTIFEFVLPKFETMFIQYGDNLPFSTKILLKIQFLYDNYLVYILFIFLFSLYLLHIVYKNNQMYFDKLIFKSIPIFSNMYKNILFYKLFLSISLIVRSKYKFQEALKNSIFIINNKYLFGILEDIIKNINNGESISKSFNNSKVFDLFVIRLLNTAQKTNKLEILLVDIVDIYSNNLNKTIERFKSFLEPFLVFLIAVIILYLVLAIMTPIWDLSSILN